MGIQMTVEVKSIESPRDIVACGQEMPDGHWELTLVFWRATQSMMLSPFSNPEDYFFFF